MRTIHICSGVPGSGKTTYTEALDKSTNFVVHRDEVRASLRKHAIEETGKDPGYFPCSAELEYKAWVAACAMAIIDHPSYNHFWFDQTTLGNGSARKFINALAEILNQPNISARDHIDFFDIHIEVFDVPLKTCLERNALREGDLRVPDDIMENMANAFSPNYMLRSGLKIPNRMNTLYLGINYLEFNENGELIKSHLTRI